MELTCNIVLSSVQISQFLTAATLPVFLEELKNVTVNFTEEVITSPANVKAIVRILSNVANKSSSLDISVSRVSMEVC